ncbi:hypothetical protein PInf_018183 [Phytophthora infestans]|nr:hypothetical protein PInf_018183 [Phytophthora infestans]
MFLGTLPFVYPLLCKTSVLCLSTVMHLVLVAFAELVQASCLHSVLGLERPHIFRNVPDQAIPWLSWEEILSNEYEDEPDLGSFSGIYRLRLVRESNVSSRVRHAAAGAGRYHPFGQPQVDQGSRALYDRVVALEQSQSAELTALQQELCLQKAQVAAAAQSASIIQVTLGSELRRLRNRVVAPEKLDHASSVPRTDVFFTAAGPTYALSVPRTDVILLTAPVPHTDTVFFAVVSFPERDT